VPKDWEKLLIVPLHKGVEVLGPKDSRGISLGSVVGKVYEGVVLGHLEGEAKGMEWSPRDPQGGYRKGHGADMWVWALTELVARHKWWVLVSLDWEKAFDKVWREAVLWKLRKMGFTGRTWKEVDRAFGRVWSAVRMGGRVSKFVQMLAGLKQGGILSPWLFALFVDDLVGDLVDAGWGSRERCEELVVLLFVDDVVLLGRTFEEAQLLVGVVAAWGKRWGMTLSSTKSVWMSNRKGGSLVLNGVSLPEVDTCKVFRGA
jgi:hypothetical protein